MVAITSRMKPPCATLDPMSKGFASTLCLSMVVLLHVAETAANEIQAFQMVVNLVESGDVNEADSTQSCDHAPEGLGTSRRGGRLL